jgi:DNA-binding GntR family transcriptional regulator
MHSRRVGLTPRRAADGGEVLRELNRGSDARFRTKQEYVYTTLLDAILRCELAPGERLVVNELAQRLNVSSIPIREALQLLQSEGLVVTVPHVGATVAPLSPEAINEVFALMEGLELVATREAARLVSRDQIAVLEGMLHEMDLAASSEGFAEMGDLNTRFHLAIAELTGMPLLYEMTARVFRRWDRLRRYYLHGVLAHRAQQAQVEHRALVQGLASGDVEALERTVREHNRASLAAYAAMPELARRPGRRVSK